MSEKLFMTVAAAAFIRRSACSSLGLRNECVLQNLVNPLPSSLTTAQHPGSKRSSSSNFLTYSNLEQAINWLIRDTCFLVLCKVQFMWTWLWRGRRHIMECVWCFVEATPPIQLCLCVWNGVLWFAGQLVCTKSTLLVALVCLSYSLLMKELDGLEGKKIEWLVYPLLPWSYVNLI